MMKCVLIACLALASFTCVSGTFWRPCPGGSKTLDFDVEGCAGQRLCTVRRGETRSLSMRFRATSDSSTLTAAVFGKSRGMSSPMPLASNSFESNACNNLVDGSECPIVRNQVYNYRMPLLIEQFFPPTTYMIQFSLKDGSSRVQSCGRMVIRVV
ncbi:hypothetical protein BOX15_Mlig018527g1 [Macrostomum lignano]|nr:hypothetical protein BOX15_Mlig018527g2 [Macrostomum lignano]PAA49423.1 hypothetical protein BOX15_Mlig018527g1 [Macrostomum lignano]